MHESTCMPCNWQSLQLAYQYAATNAQHTVVPSVSHIHAALQTHLDTWSKDWELSIAEQRTLYLAAAEVLRLSKVGLLSLTTHT